MKYIKYIIAAVWLIFCVVGIVTNYSHYGPLDYVIVIVVALVPFLIYFIVVQSKKRKKKEANISETESEANQLLENSKQEKASKEVNPKSTVWVTFIHVNGLPIAEGAKCSVYSYPDRYDFVSGTMRFSLAKSKVTDMCTRTEREIYQQYVSSAGGAVGGALLFGPLGALIGGRVKKKTDVKTRKYLIITYMTDGEVKYVGFDTTGKHSAAQKLIWEFQSYRPADTKIEL